MAASVQVRVKSDSRIKQGDHDSTAVKTLSLNQICSDGRQIDRRRDLIHSELVFRRPNDRIQGDVFNGPRCHECFDLGQAQAGRDPIDQGKASDGGFAAEERILRKRRGVPGEPCDDRNSDVLIPVLPNPL